MGDLGIVVSEKRTGRRCVFCGGPANSREHVWPQWLRASEAGQESFRSWPYRDEPHVMMRARHSPDRGRSTFRFEPRGRSVRAFDVTVKTVCRDCNTGWMANLEGEVQPLVLQLMGEQPRPDPALTLKEAQLLRRWAIKTSGMFQFNDPPTRSFPNELYPALMTNAPLPGSIAVWCGRTDDAAEHFRLAHSGAALVIRDAGESQDKIGTLGQTIMVVGPLVLVVAHCSLDNASVEAGLRNMPAGMLQPVAPGATPWTLRPVNADAMTELIYGVGALSYLR